MIFKKVQEAKDKLVEAGFEIATDFTKLKPNSVSPFGFSGEVEQLTFGQRRVNATHSMIVCLKEEPNVDIFQLMDEKTGLIFSKLSEVYQTIKLKQFDYVHYPTQKLIYVYLSFEVAWTL